VVPVDVDLTLGRQTIGVSNRELVLYADSINANVVKAKIQDLTLTGICALSNNAGDIAGIAGTPTFGDCDTTIKGITGSYPLPVGEAILGGYYLRAVTNDPNKDLRDVNNVYGFKVDGSMEIASTVNYFFEYAKQSGSITAGPKRDASALRIGGGYKTELASLGAVTVEGSYLSMSCDDVATDTTNKAYSGIASNYNYFSAMRVEGVLPTTPGSGLKALNLNASISPDAIEGVTLGFGYTKLTAAKVASGEKDDIGSEIDLTCGYKYNDKTNIDLTYARFSPGDATLKDGDPATMLKCQLVTKF